MLYALVITYLMLTFADFDAVALMSGALLMDPRHILLLAAIWHILKSGPLYLDHL